MFENDDYILNFLFIVEAIVPTTEDRPHMFIVFR